MNYKVRTLLPFHHYLVFSYRLAVANQKLATQITKFHDSTAGGFFATSIDNPHTILRLKDGMDNAEPSANGVSASNLFRLSTLLEDEDYEKLAKSTITAFEAEIMQYPWLFSSFMPPIVAANLGVKGVVRVCGADKAAVGTTGQQPIDEEAPIDVNKGVVGGETTKGGGLVEVGEAVEKVAKSHVNPTGDSRINETQAGHKSSNPAVLATQLESVSLSDKGAPLPKLKPRGALETRSYIDDKTGPGQWLKSRNKLVCDLKPLDGRDRVMVCEGRTCREADDAEAEGWAGEFREW